MKVLVLIAALIAQINADIPVTINLRNSVNEISDKFINSKIDFYKLMDVVKQQQNVTILSPSYVKLDNFTKYLRDDDNESGVGDVVALFQSLNRNKITPVITIDYSTSNFDPLALLKDLKRANELGIKECIWQLGDPSSLQLSDNGSLKKYTDDLRTLRILCDSVKRGSKSSWKVAAVGDCISSSDNASVEGYDYGVFGQSQILSSTSSVQLPSSIAPKWATISSLKVFSSPASNNRRGCHENCLIDGLVYANTLGEAAKKGFDVLFFDEDFAPKSAESFKHVINKVHNLLIGTKVFSARMHKKLDKPQSYVYAYCSKKMNGGVILMAINYADTRAKINSKLLSSSIESNSVVSQYLLSVADGHVFLNNERYNGTISPALKFKKILKHSVDFTIPPFSIMFWELKTANVKECTNIESNQIRTSEPSQTTSSDKLLQTLAAKAIIPSTRTKRQFMYQNPFLPPTPPKLDLKLANFMPSNINQRSIKDMFFNRNAEIYKVAPAAPVVEPNPLESSENPSLPTGDIYLFVNDGKTDESTNAEIEFPKRKNFKTKKPKIYDNYKRDSAKTASETHEYVIERENPYPDPYTTATTERKSSTKKSSKPHQQPQEIGEFEHESDPYYEGIAGGDQQTRGSNKNVEIKTVMRELEPTVRQSKKAILAAKNRWNQDEIMKMLETATLEEIDGSEIKDTDDFEVIDLTDDDYAEEDDDEDGFFSNGDRVRSRRSVIDFKVNEIPRDGTHYIDFDDEQEISFENIEDSHFMAPRYGYDNLKSGKLIISPTDRTTSTTETPIEDSLGVKIVDVMGKSVNSFVNNIHNTVASMFKVFEQQFS